MKRQKLPAGRRMIYALILLMLPVLAGCKEEAESWTEDRARLEKNGQVVLCVTDDFDRDFYSIEELTGMAVEEAALFNGKNKKGEGTPVEVEEVARIEETDQKVRVIYRFADPEAMGTFLGESLYYETVAEAMKNKRIFQGEVLFGAEGKITFDEEKAERFSGRHVVITNTATKWKFPYDVLYYSEGVKLLEDGTADTTECQFPAIIILKR